MARDFTGPQGLTGAVVRHLNVDEVLGVLPSLFAALADPELERKLKADLPANLDPDQDLREIRQMIERVREGGVTLDEELRMLERAGRILRRYTADEPFVSTHGTALEILQRIQRRLRETRRYQEIRRRQRMLQDEIDIIREQIEEAMITLARDFKLDRPQGRQQMRAHMLEVLRSALMPGGEIAADLPLRARLLAERLPPYGILRDVTEPLAHLAGELEAGRLKPDEFFRELENQLYATRIPDLNISLDEDGFLTAAGFGMDRSRGAFAEELATLTRRLHGYFQHALRQVVRNREQNRELLELLGLSPDMEAGKLRRALNDKLYQEFMERALGLRGGEPSRALQLFRRSLPQATRQMRHDIEIAKSIQALMASPIPEQQIQRWTAAIQSNQDVYVPKIGNVRPIALDRERARVLVKPSGTEPRSIYIAPTAEEWKAALEVLFGERGTDAGPGLVERLRNQIQSNAPVSLLLVPVKLADSQTLVLPSTLGEFIRVSDQEQMITVAEHLVHQLYPWLARGQEVGDYFRAVYKGQGNFPERYIEAVNSMWMALVDVLPTSVAAIRREELADIASRNRDKIGARFWEIFGGRETDRVLSAVRTVLSAAKKAAGVDALAGPTRISAATRDAILRQAYDAARKHPDLVDLDLSWEEFLRAVSEVERDASAAYLDQDIDFGDGKPRSRHERLADPRATAMLEEAEERVSGRRTRPDVREAFYSRLTREENPLSPYEAVRDMLENGLDRGRYRVSVRELVDLAFEDAQIRAGLAEYLRRHDTLSPVVLDEVYGEDALLRKNIERQKTRQTIEDLLEFMDLARVSVDVREALAEHLARRGPIYFDTAADAQILAEAFVQAGVAPLAYVTDEGRIIGSGRMRITERGLWVGRHHIFWDQDATFWLDLRQVQGDIRARNRYAPWGSVVERLEQGELPIVRLPFSINTAVLSGVSWRMGPDPHATLLNLRAAARGQASVVAVDTEFVDFRQYPGLERLTQFLQIGWMDEAMDQPGLINVRASQELKRFVYTQLWAYRQVLEQVRASGEADYASVERVARFLADVQESRNLARFLTSLGYDQTMNVQRERDVLNAIRQIGLLGTRNRFEREMFEAAFEYRQVGRQMQLAGIRDIDVVTRFVRQAFLNLRSGIDPSMAPRALGELIAGKTVIGQNFTSADQAVYEWLARRYGIEPVRQPVINLDIVARLMYPQGIGGTGSVRMEKLITLLDPDHPARIEYDIGAHTANVDAWATLSVYRRLRELFEERVGVRPEDIETYRIGSYFVLENPRNTFGLAPGVWRIEGRYPRGSEEWFLRFRRIGEDGQPIGQAVAIYGENMADIISRMELYGDIVEGDVREAFARFDEMRAMRRSDAIHRAMGNLFTMEWLLDVGTLGQRGQAAARRASEILEAYQTEADRFLTDAVQQGTSARFLGFSTWLGQKDVSEQLLAISGESLAESVEFVRNYLRGIGAAGDATEETIRMLDANIEAGRRLLRVLNTPAMRAIREALIQIEALQKAARFMGMSANTLRSEVEKLVQSINQTIKERAQVRTVERQGYYRLLQIQIGENNPIELFLDMRNPQRSMLENWQAVYEALRVTSRGATEDELKSQASLIIHQHLLSAGYVGDIEPGAYPSIDWMAEQARRAIEEGRVRPEVVRYEDWDTALANLAAMDESMARAMLLDQRVASSQLYQLVMADPYGRAYYQRYLSALQAIDAQGLRLPFSFGYLPIPGRDDLIVDERNWTALSPQQLIDAIHAAGKRHNELRRAITQLRAEGRHEEADRLQLQLADHANQRGIEYDLRHSTYLASRNLNIYRDPEGWRLEFNTPAQRELARLLGLQADESGRLLSLTAEDALNITLLAGPIQYQGRQLGDLTVAELQSAARLMERYGHGPLHDYLTEQVRLLNEAIVQKGYANSFDVRVRDAVAGTAERVARAIASTTQEQTAEAADGMMATATAVTRTAGAETMAREAIERTVQAATQASAGNRSEEYIIETVRNTIRRIRPIHVAGALGGAVIIGAMTLGGRGGMPRPAHNQAPMPDGEYEPEELAFKPLPPDIIMGRQVYVEPIGTGLTVRVRTRSAHNAQQMVSMIQSALGDQSGHLTVTVRDDSTSIDRQWLQQQIASLL